MGNAFNFFLLSLHVMKKQGWIFKTTLKNFLRSFLCKIRRVLFFMFHPLSHWTFFCWLFKSQWNTDWYSKYLLRSILGNKRVFMFIISHAHLISAVSSSYNETGLIFKELLKSLLRSFLGNKRGVWSLVFIDYHVKPLTALSSSYNKSGLVFKNYLRFS